MDSGFLIKCFDRFVYMGIKYRALVDIVSAAPFMLTVSLPPLYMSSAKVFLLESVNEEVKTLKKVRL